MKGFKGQLVDMKDLDIATGLLQNNKGANDKNAAELIGSESIQQNQVDKIKLAHRFLSIAQQYEFKNQQQFEAYLTDDESYQQLLKQYRVEPGFLFRAYQNAHQNLLGSMHQEERQEAKRIASNALAIMKANKNEPKSDHEAEQRLITFLQKNEAKSFKDINDFIKVLASNPLFQPGEQYETQFSPDILFDAWKIHHQEFVKQQDVGPQNPEQHVTNDRLVSNAVTPNEQNAEVAALTAAGINTPKPSPGKSRNGQKNPLSSSRIVRSLMRQSYVPGLTDQQLNETNQDKGSRLPTPLSTKPKKLPDGSG